MELFGVGYYISQSFYYTFFSTDHNVQLQPPFDFLEE